MSSFLRNPSRLINPFYPYPLRRVILTGVKAALITHVFAEYVGEIALTQGPSMLPTIEARGDSVWISKYYRRGRGIRVGDVVSIQHPLFPERYASKRVLGMPGDFVLMGTPNSLNDDMLQVPEGHCWLSGDNQPESRDSRDYGPIPLALIKGKVVARIFPFGQMKWIENTLTKAKE